MRQSELFFKPKKEFPKDAVSISHKYLLRADFIEQSISGVYRFLPLGFRVLKKIEAIVRQEMERLGAQEVFLTTLQNKNLWLETKRWENIDPPLFILKDRHNKETALAPTHEEEITDIVRKRVNSYKDLPFSLFQIQNKFRNEMRATSGLLRMREFLMKDLYSFHSEEKDLINFYEKVKKSYFNIFKKCGLKTLCVEASSGTIGGNLSHEFMVLNESGEDKVLICQNCDFSANIEKTGRIKNCPKCGKKIEEKNAIEVGHIFNLGTKYSRAMSANFKDKDGKEKPIIMGCYGIGLPRLLATIVEVHHDEKGIIWPETVAPFSVHLITIENNKEIKKTAEKLYKEFIKAGIEILYDNRENKGPGEKFAEADLIGIPWRLLLSKKTLQKRFIEVKKRREKKIKLIKIKDCLKFFYDQKIS